MEFKSIKQIQTDTYVGYTWFPYITICMPIGYYTLHNIILKRTQYIRMS